ncbi:unnamed protein product [Symbiodinium microadriaticum]|nr:unnamed protein product [Symbiodinium microadriaticum]
MRLEARLHVSMCGGLPVHVLIYILFWSLCGSVAKHVPENEAWLGFSLLCSASDGFRNFYGLHHDRCKEDTRHIRIRVVDTWGLQPSLPGKDAKLLALEEMCLKGRAA